MLGRCDDDNKLTLVQNGDETGFHYQVTDLLAMTRQHAKRQVDNTIVVTYYEVVKSTVSEHLSTIFKSAELDENSTVRNFRTVASNGKEYTQKYYNLQAIIAVGFKRPVRKLKTHL